MLPCVIVQIVEVGCLPSFRHLVVVTVLVNVVVHYKCHEEGCRRIVVVLSIFIHWPWEVEEKRKASEGGVGRKREGGRSSTETTVVPGQLYHKTHTHTRTHVHSL